VNPTNGMGPEKTFGGQSTFILPVQGRPGAFIAMFDMWRPQNHVDSRYMWLPITVRNGRFTVRWRSEWDLSIFDDPDFRREIRDTQSFGDAVR
jgi:hypothetical protein